MRAEECGKQGAGARFMRKRLLYSKVNDATQFVIYWIGNQNDRVFAVAP
jgi:hypothetical protein